MESKKDPIESALDGIKKMQDSVRRMAEESPDVKAGIVTVEEELQEPGYLLYGKINETTGAYFEMPAVQATWRKIGKSIGEEAAADIMSMMAVAMSHSAHQAVIFYDSLLKKELTKQLNLIIDQCNNNTADIKSFKTIIDIFRNRLETISGKITLEEIMGQNAKVKPE